ncbi:MAG TPA: TolC family protein [Gemmatimonadales bacterium]|nr:TolC family protein [Gemmatimonadales bacterium]
MRVLPAFLLLFPLGLGAQAARPVSRVDAIAAALARGPRVAEARADSAAARGELGAARAFPNPAASATYTKAVPRYHYLVDLPLDWPWVRAPRVGAARAGADAAGARYAFERAAAAFDADTAYTAALAATAHARLSRRTAQDADSLLRVARVRRDAGDASEMDARLAEINAGELANAAADDSLAAQAAIVSLQLVMGLPGDAPAIILTDTLSLPDTASVAPPPEPLAVTEARSELRAAESVLSLERSANIPAPAVQLGVERGDPTGAEPGALPTFGISLPLPLFSWNGGGIARARADRDRAAARLDAVRQGAAAEHLRAVGERTVALARARRDAGLVASADSVAAMFLQAYAEGAVSLPEVLEAQRNAREMLGRYVDDLALANTAAGLVRLLDTPESEP